ncbi:MAG: hypothetical protein AAF289_02515 [Cyanobacteria bacterium P01_A01_bin.135]
MKNWRFLIQQEGDRDWLPLEAPEAEILEGRYRLVGQSQQGAHSVDISLAYREFDLPKVHQRRRTAQTNGKGLVGIFPFSRLQPGLWDIKCRSQGAVATLHLRVDPQDGAPELEASPDLSRLMAGYGGDGAGAKPPQTPEPQGSAATAPVLSEAAPVDPAMVSVADLFQTVEAVADQVITALSQQLADGPPDATPERSPSTQATIELQTSAYRVEAGQPIALQGQVAGAKPSGPSTMTLLLIATNTGETIAQHIYPQTITHLPHRFDWLVPLTAALKAPLVLARLSLHPAASSDRVWPLAECSFAVMVTPPPGSPPGPQPMAADDAINPFQFPDDKR